MASIKVRVGLEGGDQVRSGLKALGDEGQAAFQKVSESTKGLGTGLAEFRERLKTVAAESRAFGESLRKVGDNVVQLGKDMAEAAKGFAVLGIAAGAALKATANAADEQGKAAQAAGVSTEAYGKLSFAFKQAGIDAAGSSKLFNKFNESVDGTSESAQKTRATLQGLGVNATRLGNGLIDTEKLIGDTAEAFSKLPDGANKSRIALELFGARAGTKLIPFLNQGRKGIKDLGDEAQRLGIVFSGEEAKFGEAFNDNLDKLIGSFAGLRNAFAVPFLEPFANAFQRASEIVSKFQEPINDIALLIKEKLTVAFEAIAAVVGPVFTWLGEQLDALFKKFNEVFGTKLTKEHVIVVAAFIAITAVVVKLASALGTMLPILGGVVKTLSGIPAILKLVTTSVKVLGSTFTALFRGVSLGLSILTGLNPATILITAAIIAFAAAVYLLVKYWPEISAAAKAAYDTIANGASVVWETVKGYWNAGVEFITSLFTAEFWVRLWYGATEAASSAWEAIKTGASDLWEKVKEYWNAGIEFIKSLFTAEFWAEIWESAKTTAAEAWEAIKAAFQAAFDAIYNYLKNTWLGKILGVIGQAITKIKEFLGLQAKANGGAGGGGGGSTVAAARGGYIRGPGSGTSDSIPARLSNGEFVQRAAAVRHYGVDFMRAINSMRLPAFSMGGLVDGLMPSMPVSRFAEGGLVGMPSGGGGGGRPVILQMPDGQSFSLNGDDGTVDNLTRYANRQNIRASGKKPVWYKG